MRKRTLRGIVVTAVGGFALFAVVTSGEAQSFPPPPTLPPNFTLPTFPPPPTMPVITTTPPPTMPVPTSTPPPTMPPPTSTPPPTMPPLGSDDLRDLIDKTINELDDFGSRFQNLINALRALRATL